MALTVLLSKHGLEPETRYFQGILSILDHAGPDAASRQQIARDSLRGFSGMGSLNDLVVMVGGRADPLANAELHQALNEFPQAAIELATAKLNPQNSE